MNQLKFLMAMLLCGTGLVGLNAQVNLNVGELPPGKSITVTYLAAVDNPFPTGLNTLTAQGNVSGTNFPSRLTDDPETGAPDDATVTMVAPVVVGCMDTVYVNDGSTTGDHYTTAVGNDANPGTKAAPVLTISQALELGCSGSYIYVDAGVYEDTLTLDSTYYLRGSNYGINPNTGGRVAESIIYPPYSDPDPNSATGVYTFYITPGGSGSEIDGFTMDGDNPGLVSGVVYNGADVDAVEGVGAYEGISNVAVTNNIIRHYTYAAIEFYNYYNGGAATTGNLISANLFDNILPDTSSGIGVLIYNNCYTTIINNVMTDVRIGVQTGNFYQADPGNSHDISGNDIESGRLGIWHNLVYTNAANFTITNNNITTANYWQDNQGLKITSIQTNVGVLLENNSVDGADIGLDLWNNPTANTITAGYNVFSNCDTAIFANNYDGYSSNATTSSYILDNVAINTSTVGILVKDNNSNSNGATVSVEIKGNSTIDSDKGLVIEGSDAFVSLTGPTPISFSNQSAYIDQRTNGSGFPGTDMDATGVLFDGLTGAGMNSAQRFATEDKINHKPDLGSLGLVTFVPTNIFITTNSFITPHTTAPSIQAGVDIMSAGSTVNVDAGTYNEDLLIDKDNMSVIGAGIDQTTIDHTGQPGHGNAGVYILANGVNMEGFTVTGNKAASVPRYGLKVGTSSVTTDDVVLDSVKVTQSYRTGFDLARPKDITLKNLFAIDNDGAGIFMTNTEGAVIEDVTTSGNPWTGIAISTRNDWTGDASGIYFIGNNSFAEDTSDNGGVQLEMVPGKTISWSSDSADGMDVTIQGSELQYVLSGPTINAPYDPYVRLFMTLNTARDAAGGDPDHVEIPRYIHNAYSSTLPDSTNFYVFDFADTAMTIQAAINAAVAGNIINVDTGTFEEDVLVNKTLTVQGSGMGSSTILGQKGGDIATVRASATGVKVDGFTITRVGNNTSEWNDSDLNSTGVAIQGQAPDAEISNNEITGNRTGIDINNSNHNNIHNNRIHRNHTGMIFRNQTDNTDLIENSIVDNRTAGVLFLDASGGTNSPLQQALNSNFNNNDISGNWYGQIVDRQAGGTLPTPGTTNIKNFECNWYGTTMPEVSTNNSNEPNYTVLIPTYYGGTATDTSSNADILGPASANFDYIFFLTNGTDNSGDNGFQPVPNSCDGCPGGGLVTNINTGNMYCSIQEAIDDAATTPGDTITIAAGTYLEDVLVNKADLTIIGAGIDQTTIDHTGQSGQGNAGVHILANGVTMKGLTVTGNQAVSTPRYGLKVGTSSVTTDDVTLDSVKVTQSYRTGFDLARPKDITLKNVFAIDNGGAGIFMSNAEGATIESITTSGNPWTGVSVSTRHDWAGDSYGIVFTGTNSLGENAGKNGGLQLESDTSKIITWGNDIADGKDVTIQQNELSYALSGPTTNVEANGGDPIYYAPYFRFYQTLAQAQSAAGIGPDHVNIPRYIQDANCSTVPDTTNFYVFDFADTAMTVQAAVNAASPENTVNVFAGTFEGQVVISKNLKLLGVDSSQTIIQGVANMDSSFTTSAVNKPVIYVHDADDVLIQNLQVDGDGQGTTNARYFGIAYNNASGLVDRVLVKGTRTTPLNGAQHGNGIFGNASAGTPRTLEVNKSCVYDFQKIGIFGANPDLTFIVDSSEVYGQGPLGSGFPAQNGIQTFATKYTSLTNNLVDDIFYTGGGTVASGILLLGDDSAYVSQNMVTRTQAGIVADGGVYEINSNVLDSGTTAIRADLTFATAFAFGSATTVRASNNAITNYSTGYSSDTVDSGESLVSKFMENSVLVDGIAVSNIDVNSIDATCNWYGTTNSGAIDALISGPVVYTPYLIDGTDNSGNKGFQPVPDACAGPDCPDGSCDGCYVLEPFNEPVNVSSSQAPDTWYTDRFAPDSFYVDGSDSTLVHLIDAADGQNNRSVSFNSAFYNTQGRKYDLYSTTTMLSIDLYVPSSWATTGRRMAGIWGTGFDSADAVSTYPIIEFTSDSTPRFRAYEGDGSWIDMGLPCDFAYDQWHTMRIELLPTGEFRYSVDDLRVTTELHGVNGTEYIGNIILQGHNTTSGVTYEINWDNFINGNGPTLENDATLPEPIAVGSGISNEHMAIGEFCGIDAGLKAIKRFLGDVTPVDGDAPGDTYQFGTGVSPQSSANSVPDSGTARWNFVFSVNLGDYTFNDLNVFLDVDFDASDSACGVGPYVANISQLLIDSGYGGLSAYQASENLGFNYWQAIGDSAILPFDPYAEGVYDLTLRIENKQGIELMDIPIRVEVSCDFVNPEDDLEPPVLACPSDTTIYLTASADPWSTGMATTSGSCGQNVTYSDSTAVDSCGESGVIIRTWSLAYGDSTQTCSQTITILDTTAPVLSACPADTALFATSDSGATLDFVGPTAEEAVYFEGFESPAFQSGSGSYQGWNDFNSPLVRVASGTGGITSSSGTAHGLIDTNGSAGQTGVFGRLGGYRASFGNGFTTSLDVYIDLADPAVAADTYGWDLTTAASTQSGGHLRDFIFHAASNASGNVLIAGSNNTNFTRRNDLASLNNHEITTSGWYTFEWVFRDSAGSLAVDLNLSDAAGNHLLTETRYNAADNIATTVGGNRYMWFTFLETESLAIDNTSMVRDAAVSCSATSGSTFAAGTTTVTCSSTDSCGNMSSCSFDVMVLDTAGALNYDGANDVVVVPHDASLTNFGTAITVEAWIKPETVSGNHGVVGKWNDLGSNNRRSYLLWARDDDAQFYISSNGSDFPSALASNVLTTGEWTHLAGTYDGATVKLYVNGVLTASTPFSGSIANNTADPLLIGAVDGGGSSRRFFDGDLDEVRIYGRALCQSEIQAHMNCELDSGVTGLAAHYDFNQGYAQVDNTGLDSLIDRSGNGNDGMLQNFALMGSSSNWTFQADSVNGSCAPYDDPGVAVYGNNQLISDGDALASPADGTDFGTQLTGSSTTNTFYIVNTGTDALLISDTVITGPDAAHFAVASLSNDNIAPGDSAALGITYSPTTAAVHNATVQVVTNACNAATFDFAIKGNADQLMCDTVRFVSDSSWRMSTVVTPSNFSGGWSGVMGNLPASNTFTQPVTLGQPYSFQTIFPVDSSKAIKAGNNITYYRKTFMIDTLSGIGSKILSTMDDQMELYVNGQLVVGQYLSNGQNGRLPGYGAQFFGDTTVDNGFNGTKTYGYTNPNSLDDVFKPGTNEVIYVLRNLGKAGDAGGFSFSMEVDGCEGNPDTVVVPPQDPLCDTVYLISDAKWKESTVVTASNFSGGWNGVMGNLPDTSTFTQAVMLGQPYNFQTIFPVDSSQVVKAGNNIRYFYTTIMLDSLVDLNAKLLSTMDDQMELYVNDILLAGQYIGSGQNGRLPGYGARFNNDSTVDNGFGGSKTYGYTTTQRMDNVFRPGLNEVIYVLRNRANSNEAGGFSMSLQVDGCMGNIAPPDTTTPVEDTVTNFIVSNNGWEQSTVVEGSNFSGDWSGASALPPSSTYTLPAEEGQPYNFTSIENVDSSKVIKSGNNIRFFRRRFVLTDSSGLDARFRMTGDDGFEIYLNGTLVARENNSGSANYVAPVHDLQYSAGAFASNGAGGSQPFDVVASLNLNTIFTTDTNEVVVALRNKGKANDLGGFSFRLDLEKAGSPVIVKSGSVNPKVEIAGDLKGLDFVLYPNPTTGMVNIKLTQEVSTTENEIMLQDASGRIISRNSFESFAEEGGLKLDMSSYPAGIYLIRLKAGDRYISKRLIKN